MVDHRPPDTGEVGIAVVDRLPLGADLAGQLRAKRRLVDVARRFCLAQKRRLAPRVGEAEPAPIRGGAGHVGGDEVGVKGRIAGPRGAVAEAHRKEAGPRLDRDAALAPLHEARGPLQVADRLGNRVIVGAKDGGADLRRADRIEQGDRLRRGKANVVAEDRVEVPLAPFGVYELPRLGPSDQDVAGEGMLAGENGSVGIAVNLAREAKLRRQLAHPLARRLAWLRVVIVAAFGYGFDPVIGVGAADLRHSHHRPCCPPRGPIASGGPEGFVVCRAAGLGLQRRWEGLPCRPFRVDLLGLLAWQSFFAVGLSLDLL